MKSKGASPDKVWKLLLKNIRKLMEAVDHWRELPYNTDWAETYLKYLHELE